MVRPMSNVQPFSQIICEQAADATLRKGERTRLRLMAACAESLEDTPFATLRVADVCTRADVSQGTFYIYFKDKTAVAVETLTAFALHVQEYLGGTAPGAHGLPHAIQLATLRYVQLFQANRGLMRCLLQDTQETAAFQTIYQDLNARWNRRTATAIARYRGTASTPDDLVTAYALSGMVDDFLANLYIRHDPTLLEAIDQGSDPDAVARVLAGIWLAAIQ